MNTEKAAKESAEVTKEVAVGFVVWMANQGYDKMNSIETIDYTKDDEYLAKQFFKIKNYEKI